MQNSNFEDCKDYTIYSETTPFAFTLRKSKFPRCKSDYVDRMAKIEELGCSITDHVYESTAGLHLHGIIQVPKDFNHKKLRVRGWRIQLDEIYNYAGWLSYITKECNLIQHHVLDAIDQQENVVIPIKKLF